VNYSDAGCGGAREECDEETAWTRRGVTRCRAERSGEGEATRAHSDTTPPLTARCQWQKMQ
jgi:hypothetical protein